MKFLHADEPVISEGEDKRVHYSERQLSRLQLWGFSEGEW